MSVINQTVGNTIYFTQPRVDVWTQVVTPFYGTLVGADNYFKTRLRTHNWDNAESDERLKALHMATRYMEALHYKGKKESDDQILFFPRHCLDGGRVPGDIEEACYECALALLNGVDPEVEARNLSVTGQGYAGARTSYDRDFTQEHVRANIPSSHAWSLIKPYLADPKALKVVRDT